MLLELDIHIVEFFNKLTEIDFFRYLFLGITYLGNEYAFIVIIGITYWAINKRIAKDVGIASFYSLLFNGLIKGFFSRLRPFQQSPSTITCRDQSILAENASGQHYYVSGPNGDYLATSSSSFPSGHSQGASGTYNSFAVAIKKRWVWIVMNVVCLLVMISRMALGVHYFSDVLVGYLLGLGCILLIFYLRKKAKNEWLLHIILLSVFAIVTFLSPLWNDAPKDMFSMLGVTIGCILGIYLEEKKVNFSHTKSIWKNVLRAVFGILVVLAIKEGLKPLFKLFYDSNTEVGIYFSYVFDFIRYGLMTFIAIGIYPMLFNKIKFLSDVKKEA